MSDVDRHIAQILDALDCEPRGAWMPSEALVRAFIDEIFHLRKELAEARNKALDEAAEYHDDQSVHHSAHKSASNHHEMMAREHRRFADAIRNLKDTTNDQSR